MSASAGRVGVVLAAWSAGAVLGLMLGGLKDWPVLGALSGSLAGVLLAVFADARRGRKFLRWLRGDHGLAAPRDAGFWGELGYWSEKALRRREQAIKTEKARLDQFLMAIEAAPNGVMMLDPDEHIDWFNKVAADHFGLSPERDRGQRVTNLVRTPAFRDYLRAGRYDEPVSFIGPKGRATLSVLVQPYGDGLKLVLSQDITARERTEAMRRDFVANVSHEIRTPLTVLAGFVETMGSLPLDDKERERVLALMQQQTQRMQVLVGDLLILAQLEGSPRPDADTWVRLDDVMAIALRDATALSAARHQIRFDGPPGIEIAGQSTELHSAVGNLLSNAVRYTPQGGRIDVRWALGPDGACEIQVEDNGPGIPREHLPRLTERFYRVDGSRSRDTGGTGLGLSIVKHVMQRHGGRIDIDSVIGRGSRFKLVFPEARSRSLAKAA